MLTGQKNFRRCIKLIFTGNNEIIKETRNKNQETKKQKEQETKEPGSKEQKTKQ